MDVIVAVICIVFCDPDPAACKDERSCMNIDARAMFVCLTVGDLAVFNGQRIICIHIDTAAAVVCRAVNDRTVLQDDLSV